MKKIVALLTILCLCLIGNAIVFADGESELPVFNKIQTKVGLIQLSPDGKYLVNINRPSGTDQLVELWNIESGVKKQITEKVYDEELNGLAFSHDGKRFAITMGGVMFKSQILLFDSKSGVLQDSIELKGNPITGDLSFTSDNQNLIVEASKSLTSKTLKFINISSKTELFEVSSSDEIQAIKHNPQNNEFALLINNSVPYKAERERIIQIRNNKDGSIVKTLTENFSTDNVDTSAPNYYGGEFDDLAYSPDGKYLVYSNAIYDKSKTILLDVTKNYEQVGVVNDYGRTSFSKDSQFLVLGNKVYPIEDRLTTSYNLVIKNSKETINPTSSSLTGDGKYLVDTSPRTGSINILDASSLSIRLASIAIQPDTITIGVNDSLPIKIVGTYTDGSKKEIVPDKIQWSTDDFSIAEVKKSNLYGIGNGKTSLKAKYGGLSASVNVTVTDAPSGLAATFAENKVALKWIGVKNKSGLLGYNIYRGTTKGNYDKTPITDFLIQGTEYTDSNIKVDQDYYYICKAVYKDSVESAASNEVPVSPKNKEIVLQVNNPYMYINGTRKELDAGNGTTPVIYNGRTLLPIRIIIEELGGTLEWLGTEQKISIQLNGTKIELWVNKDKTIVNGIEKALDVPPTIIKERTMIPLRFVTENLDLYLKWDADTQKITLSYGKANINSPNESAKWFELEYTQPVSDTFGKYIDGGIGFSMNYPLTWGKPKVTESSKYSYGTITTFYKSVNTEIISYGDSLKQNESYEAYLNRSGINKSNIVSEGKIQNSDKVYYINVESGNSRKVIIMVFKQSEVCVLENIIYDVNQIQQDKEVLDLFVEIINTFRLDAAVG